MSTSETPTVTVRPSLSSYFRRAITSSPITYLVIAVLIVAVVVSGALGSVVFWTAAAAGVVSEIARVRTSFTRERIEYGADRYVVHERDGHTKTFTAVDIAQAVAVRSRRRGHRDGEVSRLYLASASGERLLRVVDAYWRGSDLSGLTADLRSRGVQVHELEERTAASALKQKYPWALDRWESHGRWILFALAGIMAAALIIERVLS